MRPNLVYTARDLLRQHVGREAGPCLVDGDRRVGHDELWREARQLGAVLVDAGVQRGDRVAILLTRSVEAVTALFAVFCAGGVAVIVNEKLRSRQVDYILEHSAATILLSDDRLVRRTSPLSIATDRVLSLDRLPEVGDREPASIISRDLAMIVYTSGSTGMPRGVMLSHENLVAGARTVADYLQLSQDDVLISLMPFSFDFGLNQLTSALFVGASLVIQRSMLPADICRTLVREKVTGMACVPLLWTQLSQDYSPFLKTSLPSLRVMTNTGGRFPVELVPRFRRAHPGADLVLMYGLTEAFRSTYLPPAEVSLRPDSIGRAIPDVEILVVDDDGKPCDANQPGELVHRGAHVALGYWRDPEATARVFRPHPFAPAGGPVETVVYSGDIVRRDPEGNLYFLGRRDAMLKSLGFRVSPEEVEHYLGLSGLVASSVVIGVEESIVAFVVPRDQGYDEAALRQYCRRELPEYMRPSEFWVVPSLPQTASGKPDRVQLREQYHAR